MTLIMRNIRSRPLSRVALRKSLGEGVVRRKAMLQDMAIVTGGKAIIEDLGIKLENIKLEDLGAPPALRS